MGTIMADITMSLDGFVTGPDPDLEHGLGRGGEPQQLVKTRVQVSSHAAHLSYRLR
jgi:hypothetical protein